MVRVALHVHHLRLHVFGLVANGVNDHATTYRAVWARTAGFRCARDLQCLSLRICRSQIKTQGSSSDAANCCEFQEVSSRGIHDGTPGASLMESLGQWTQVAGWTKDAVDAERVVGTALVQKLLSAST